MRLFNFLKKKEPKPKDNGPYTVEEARYILSEAPLSFAPLSPREKRATEILRKAKEKEVEAKRGEIIMNIMDAVSDCFVRPENPQDGLGNLKNQIKSVAEEEFKRQGLHCEVEVIEKYDENNQLEAFDLQINQTQRYIHFVLTNDKERNHE